MCAVASCEARRECVVGSFVKMKFHANVAELEVLTNMF
jgi:hypothetical protein